MYLTLRLTCKPYTQVCDILRQFVSPLNPPLSFYIVLISSTWFAYLDSFEEVRITPTTSLEDKYNIYTYKVYSLKGSHQAQRWFPALLHRAWFPSCLLSLIRFPPEKGVRKDHTMALGLCVWYALLASGRVLFPLKSRILVNCLSVENWCGQLEVSSSSFVSSSLSWCFWSGRVCEVYWVFSGKTDFPFLCQDFMFIIDWLKRHFWWLCEQIYNIKFCEWI